MKILCRGKEAVTEDRIKALSTLLFFTVFFPPNFCFPSAPGFVIDMASSESGIQHPGGVWLIHFLSYQTLGSFVVLSSLWS